MREAVGPVQATPRVAKAFCGSQLLGSRRTGDAHTKSTAEHYSPAAPSSWLAADVVETTTAWAWRRAQQVVTRVFYQLREGQPIAARPGVAPGWPP